VGSVHFDQWWKNYAAHGVNGWQGRRFFSVSGDVKRPRRIRVPMGLTLRELIHGEQYCGGIAGDRALKAFAPSGRRAGSSRRSSRRRADCRVLTPRRRKWQALAARRGFDPAATELDILDLELELNLFRALSPTQALGAGLVVYAEGRDMAAEAVKSAEFFRNESCGKCVPCRTGSQKFASLGSTLARWQHRGGSLEERTHAAHHGTRQGDRDGLDLAGSDARCRCLAHADHIFSPMTSRSTSLPRGNRKETRADAWPRRRNVMPEPRGSSSAMTTRDYFSRDIDGQLVRLDSPDGIGLPQDGHASD